ncbi:threonine/serine ThrE exporter family protein [Zafaria sp. J156]|uniref:threonine/serine ThrE exporter family protein n=1 Tax=Zafaria sp. J156 TaxID=3116490 RepID=UPI002E78EB14|nr:threonine/serine exporter family protein [Zafaria sp. J156]MEE1622433.1 threonine/serine exporter family protein [Zafaria sp. J156]
MSHPDAPRQTHGDGAAADPDPHAVSMPRITTAEMKRPLPRPAGGAVLAGGSAELPGSPDDRSKTEPDWDGAEAAASPGPDSGNAEYDAAAASAEAAALAAAQWGTGAVDLSAAPPSDPNLPDAARRAAAQTAEPVSTALPIVDAPAAGRAGRAGRPPKARPKTGRLRQVPRRPGTGTAPTVPVDAAPRTGPRPTPGARRMLARLMETEAPPTQAFSIVDRLVGSPYANPTIQVGAQDASARKTLEFALDLAEAMFRYGAGALEAETSIIAVTASLGLRNVDVDITNQSIHLNYAPADQVPISILRVVRSWTSNYAGLALLHQLVSDIVAGGVTRQQAVDRLQDITRRPKPFPRWMVTAAGGGFSAMFVMFIGGSWVGALVAFASFGLVAQAMKTTAKWRVPEFFSIAFGSLVITAIAMVLWAFKVPISPAIVVAGGIMLLLPSSRFVSSVQDAINGFPVTAAGRFFSALLIYAAIISGIMTALVLGSMAGVEDLDVTQIDRVAYPWWLLVLFVGAAVLCGAVFEQTARNLLLPTAGVALLGYLAMIGVQALGVGDRLTPAIAAAVVGAAGRWVALRMGAPQLVVAVPAVVFLLPGLMIFRAMYGITIDAADMSAGLIGMFNAFTIILAIAGGVVLGDTVARPLTKGWNSHERRRIRRR